MIRIDTATRELANRYILEQEHRLGPCFAPISIPARQPKPPAAKPVKAKAPAKPRTRKGKPS
jgi:hypothetical protein